MLSSCQSTFMLFLLTKIMIENTQQCLNCEIIINYLEIIKSEQKKWKKVHCRTSNSIFEAQKLDLIKLTLTCKTMGKTNLSGNFISKTRILYKLLDFLKYKSSQVIKYGPKVT